MSWICINCETENEVDSAICSICGTIKEENYSKDKRHEANYSSYNEYAKPNAKSGSGSSGISIEGKVFGINNKIQIQKIWLLTLSIFILVLFLFNYVKDDNQLKIVSNINGVNGDIEQICSIVLLSFIIITYLIALPKYKVRKRNTPVTFAVVSALCTTIYCCVIWFGNSDSTIVPFLIILIGWINAGIVKSISSTYKELENAYFINN